MTGIVSKLRSAAVLAPLVLLASCASDRSARNQPEARGSLYPAPLTAVQGAAIAERHTGGGDARLSIVDQIDDGWLFGVESGFDNGRRPPRESRLLFVHNDGTVRQWPGR